jgi:nucleotide-binding universal stress UspA family protein
MPPRIKKILAPIDFSSCSTASLAQAAEFARQLGAELEVLHVWEMPHGLRPDLMVWIEGTDAKPVSEIAREDAAREMESFLAASSPATRPHADVRLEGGDPVDRILLAARERGADLIVMGTHGRRGLSHLLLGSVAEKVVRRAHCPVLTVPAPGGA